MSMLFHDVRFGVRMMAKSPIVSGVAILSLSLGIAANASMFSVLNSFLFEPLPYGDQEELVLLREVRQGESIETSPGTSIANFRDFVEGTDGFESATAYTIERANVTGLDVPEQLQVVVATPSLFDVLEAHPFMGRGFRADEGAPGAGDVLVLSHDYWLSRFLGDPEVLGRTITLDGSQYTVIGVMGEAFDMIPANVQALRPTDFRSQATNRDERGYIAFGRLRTGVTATAVSLQLAGVSQRLAADSPETNRGWTLRVVPLSEWFPGPTDSQLLRILAAVTLFGLLIACANVANLLLGRAEVRQKEVAVRTALGAGRGRIFTQLLTESVLLGTAAGVLGALMSVWVIGWLQTSMPPELPRAMTPVLNAKVLLATMLVSILAGIAFGMAPALHAVRADLRDSLGSGGRGGTAGRRRKRLRNAFVVSEFAVALALLSGSGFLIQAFDRLANDDMGFDSGQLLTFQLSVLEDRYTRPERIGLYEHQLVRALGDIPGVEGVAVMSSLPRGRGNPTARYTIDGRPVPELTERVGAGLQIVNREYFTTMAIPLRDGRFLQESDRADASRVAVVSEALVAREFPGEVPIGKQLTVRGESRRIVGVVGNILQDRIALQGRGGEQIYLPLEQAVLRAPSFAVRTVGDPAELAADVREAVWSVEADQPIALLRTLDDHIAESLAGPRAISIFLMVMGGIALALAAMGIYGVMAHAVTQQRREIGIRMALGAERGAVVSMVARSGLGLVGMGLLAGLPLAFLMFRGTLSMLNLFSTELGFGLPLALSGALLVVAVAATLIPATRASGVAPVAALRE